MGLVRDKQMLSINSKSSQNDDDDASNKMRCVEVRNDISDPYKYRTIQFRNACLSDIDIRGGAKYKASTTEDNE